MFALRNAPAALSACEILRSAVLRLQQAHIESASLDARLLMEHVLGISREKLLADQTLGLAPEQEAQYESLIARRAEREPMAHLLGKREFYGREFMVSAATLDPRPDSETLIDSLLAQVPDRNAAYRIVDLGTGTGCLLLTLLKELPNAIGVGVDISLEALAVARVNADRLGCRDRVQWLHSHWWSQVQGRFEIVISNPPYIPSAEIQSLSPEVARFEPKLALDGGEDGLQAYRAIMKHLPSGLVDHGMAAFEIGFGQQQDVMAIAEQYGLRITGLHDDMAGIARCIIVKK